MKEKWVIELPHYHFGAGGITASLQLGAALQKEGIEIHIRFQHQLPGVNYDKIGLAFPFSIGVPDKSFPPAAVAMTYSDSPFVDALAALPQVRRVAINMLSYGMAIHREKHNCKVPGITVFTTTKRTRHLIRCDGSDAYLVGHGHDFENFYPEPGIKRGRLAALLFNAFENKKYALGVEIVNRLSADGLIDGVLTFGCNTGYDKFKHPKKLICHYANAGRAEVRELFSRASVFIMPSVTEGLNLTPIESTLCGCPAVLSDGAFDDFFFPGRNCLAAGKNNLEEYIAAATTILWKPGLAEAFRIDMQSVCKNFSWEATAKAIIEILKKGAASE